MAINRATREKNVASVPVELAPAEGDKAAQILNVDMRRTGRGYGQVKQLVAQSREANRMTTQASRKKRELTRLQSRLDSIIDQQSRIPKLLVPENAIETIVIPSPEEQRLDAELESVSEQLDTMRDELNDLEAKAASSIESLIDWMAGEAIVAGGMPSLGAIADWDFYVDEAQTEKVPITREALEEFEPAEIALIANRMLEALNVEKQNATGSSTR